MASPSLADEARNETKRQLEHVGFWCVAGAGYQPPDVVAKLNSGGPTDVPGTLTTELCDAKSSALLWRRVAQSVLADGGSKRTGKLSIEVSPGCSKTFHTI